MYELIFKAGSKFFCIERTFANDLAAIRLAPDVAARFNQDASFLCVKHIGANGKRRVVLDS